MGFNGGPTSVPWGDIEELYLDYDVRDAVQGAYITISHPPGYGNMWNAIVSDQRVVEIIFIAEGEKQTRFASYDPKFPGGHAVSAFPLGDWDSTGDIDVTIGQVDFVSDKGGSARFDFPAIMQIAESWGDLQQLDNWTLTGLARFATSRPGAIKTQAKVDVAISDSAGTRTVVLSVGGIAVASGSRVGDGTITLLEANNSQLSGSVDIAYSADVSSGCWITGRWCQSYLVQVGSASVTVVDNGRGDLCSATLSGIAAGVHTLTITATSDTGVVGTEFSQSITIPGRPLPPGKLSYVSGDWSDTIVAALASATPGATYHLLDVEELGGPVKYSEVAATYPAGTGTIQFALPSLAAPAAGVRRIVIAAMNGAVEDGVRRKLSIEYDAAGAVVLPRPNVPQFDYARPTPVTLGRRIACDWSYDATDSLGVATQIVAFLVAEGGAIPADGDTPDAVASVGVGRGTIAVTAPDDGNYQILVRARTAAGTQSLNNNVLTEPVVVSNSMPPAVSDVVVTVVQ